jgi:TetR/AcrR family transcriptional regulator, transcriptional repressor for nem operon
VVQSEPGTLTKRYARVVPGQEPSSPARRLTARGAVTRSRIVEAASELMFVQGVPATTLDEVMAASGTSKSQLYHHFTDKEALVREVVSLRASRVLEREQQYLGRLGSMRGLERWKQAVLQRVTLRRGAFGCALGSLVGDLADHDEDARNALARHFESWQALLASGLQRMVDNGTLRPDTDPAALATGLMAALQGGYLLAQTAHDAAPMRIALDMALEHIRSYSAVPE